MNQIFTNRNVPDKKIPMRNEKGHFIYCRPPPYLIRLLTLQCQTEPPPELYDEVFVVSNENRTHDTYTQLLLAVVVEF